MRTGSILAIVTCVAGVAPPARAQNRDRPADSAPGQPQPRCTVRAQSGVPIPAPGAAPGSSLPDARYAPALVATDEALLVAWRARDDRLYVTRLGPGFVRLGEDREVAGPVDAFAMIPAAGGAALAAVERTVRGDRVVLLARLTAQGEARNVPRELGRGEAIEGVSLAYTGAGYLVGWGAREGESASSWVSGTDLRGTPRGSPTRALGGGTPRVLYVPSAEEIVLSAASTDGDARIGMLDADGIVPESTRWPAASRALVVGGAAGATVWSVGASSDAAGNSTVSLARWLLAGPAIEISSAWRAAPGTQVSAVVPDRGGVAALLDEPSGREVLVRFAGDGTSTLLATRAGSQGSAISAADGSFTLAGYDRAGALSVITLTCPRPPAPVPATTAPVASVANPSATVNNAGTLASPSNAGDAATSTDASTNDP